MERSRVLLKKLTVPQLVNKFPVFYGTRILITAFTRDRHLCPAWARSVTNYISFPKCFPYVVRHLDSIASYLPTGLPIGFFCSWASLYLHPVFLRSSSCSLLFRHPLDAISGNLPSAIFWTWPYHVSWFCSISFIIVSSRPICCLIATFLILSYLDILEDLLRATISINKLITYSK